MTLKDELLRLGFPLLEQNDILKAVTKFLLEVKENSSKYEQYGTYYAQAIDDALCATGKQRKHRPTIQVMDFPH